MAGRYTLYKNKIYKNRMIIMWLSKLKKFHICENKQKFQNMKKIFLFYTMLCLKNILKILQLTFFKNQ